MQPLVFEKSPITLAEYESINWKYLRKTRKLLFAFPLLMIGVFCMNTCGSLAQNNADTSAGVAGSLMSLAFMLLLYGLLYYSVKKTFKKNYLNTPALTEGLTYTLSEDSIAMEASFMNGNQPWPASFKQAVKIEKWILLSSSGATAYFLDTEKLVPPATINDIAELFQQKGILMK